LTDALLTVQISQLSLTLIELVQVAVLQRDSRMCLVHFHAKVILYMLYRQILPHRPKLVVYIFIASLLFEQHTQCLFQDVFWAHFVRMWCGCQAEIGLLDLGGRAPDTLLG